MSTDIVTAERVASTLGSHGIEATTDASGRGVHATVGDVEVMLVILDSVLIARTASVTEVSSGTPDPKLYLAANQVNAAYPHARCIVVNREENITLRTEAELPIAAGLDGAQLDSALTRAINAVTHAQDMLKAVSEQFGA
ncbi:YbjN domain-containing protein [Corynebacterium liangguodongii]|uniref:Uncharacterized protein n=1 Tax=Corynebacterium liangguodongii TaxID=2079535 RepID=A0A2S0WEJ2_9CORY|nr:YbjN domain-containing protein [Corynebacterium liangguodongii]AWB84082.1 hypothetical protein C3E79_05980 [Corynebacterium liangguodongii]PWC00093.1 hypothetical protein DF219_02620 [Corynebacterium liangguodongii]